MKKRLALFISLGCIALNAYQASPSTFPTAFIDAVQQAIEKVTDMVEVCDDISRVIGPICLMSKTASFSTIKKMHANLEALTMSEHVGTNIDAVRIAGLYKLAVPLVVEMNTQLLAQLAELETVHTFWKEAEEYYMPRLLHSKKPRCIVRSLELLQEELYELLGSIVVHVAAMPLTGDADVQYEWFRLLCNYFNKALPRQKTITTKPIFESVSALFSKAISSVEKFPASCQRRLKPYAVPSWVSRNCIGLLSTAAALGGLSSSGVKYKDNIVQAGDTVKQQAQLYGNGVANALWRKDNEWEEELGDKETILIDSYKRVGLSILPYFITDQTEREKAIELLISQKLNDLNFNKTFEKEDGELQLIMSEVRSKSKFDISELQSVAGLEGTTSEGILKAVYCPLFGTTDIPHEKNCLAGLNNKFINTFNKDSLDEAAAQLDFHYFGNIISLLGDTFGKEGEEVGELTKNIVAVLADTDLGTANNVRNALSGVLPSWMTKGEDNNFTHKDIGESLQRIITILKNEKIEVGNTLATIPKVGALGGRLAAVKAERKYFETWKKTKLLVMIIISYSLFRVGKDMLWPPLCYFLKRSRPSSKYDNLLELLRELKKLFLVNGEKQQAEMDPYDVGLMHYLVHRLEMEEHIPKKFHKKYVQDVRLLQAGDLSAHQKYNIVKDVLQEGYPFLRPTVAA